MATLALLALTWPIAGILIGYRRTDIVAAPTGGWIALAALWAACGPFAGLLPRR